MPSYMLRRRSSRSEMPRQLNESAKSKVGGLLKPAELADDDDEL
jgi:hypothetical protein